MMKTIPLIFIDYTHASISQPTRSDTDTQDALEYSERETSLRKHLLSKIATNPDIAMRLCWSREKDVTCAFRAVQHGRRNSTENFMRLCRLFFVEKIFWRLSALS
jgi:hypothetical protein